MILCQVGFSYGDLYLPFFVHAQTKWAGHHVAKQQVNSSSYNGSSKVPKP